MPHTLSAPARVLLRLFTACLILVCLSHSHAQTPASTLPVGKSATVVVMQGFSVDMSRLNPQQQAFIMPVLSAQFELIHRADLPPLMLAFMKTIPVVVDPGLPVYEAPAMFSNGHSTGIGVVTTSLVPMPFNKPVLLHEMLMAYDWNYWRFEKLEIQSAYTEAKNLKLYPKWSDSTFMQDAQLFFAGTGTAYVMGKIKQPPFDCRVVYQSQPEYAKFLQSILGKRLGCD